MNYQDAKQQINSYHAEITALREKMRSAQGDAEPEVVQDYTFSGVDGPVQLSELFGANDTLFIVHNMGRSCRYCTLWADGLNGVIDHLQSRAAFAITSPDTPEVQQEFAKGRGWRVPIYSHAGTSFAEDMGYRNESGWHPGVSVFRRSDQGIVRISDTAFGPGDDFCSVWHLFDLMPEGPAGWQPQYQYADA